MKAVRIALLSALIVCVLALATPSTADYNYAGWQVTNRVNGTVNGGVFFDYEPWPGGQGEGTRNLSASFDVPSGTVKHAYLYTGVWGGSQYWPGWINATFNGIDDQNGLGPIHLEGTSDTNSNVWGTGKGKYWWWYNVTNLTNAGAINTARTKKINGTIDGRVYGIVLVVVYEGGGDPKNVSYWLNDGCDSLYDDTKDSGTTDFSGTVDNCSVTDANLTLAWMTADLGCDDCAKFNGHEQDTSMVDSDTFQMTTWDVASYVESSGNDAWYDRGWDSYVSVPNAILVLSNANTNITSCNETTGIEQNTFLPGENVSVRGGNISAGTYKIWIQPDGVNASNKLLNASADPSGTQEPVVVGESGCFGPIAIWNISESAPITFAEYDIVVDKQSDGVNTGNFSAHDGIDGACVAGFVAPVPELPTVVLLGAGLLMLAGYVHLGRRGKGRRKK